MKKSFFMRMQRGLMVLGVAGCLLWAMPTMGQSVIPYSVPAQLWPEEFGNHRAVIHIDKAADAVHIDFLWRRHDADPDKRKMWIIKDGTGEEVKNIRRIKVNREQCELVFGPVTPGNYHFYYLSYPPVIANGGYHKDYNSPETAPDTAWDAGIKKAPKVQVSELQSRTDFDSFFPMEVTATQKETEAYLKKHADKFLVFPETRTYPIRMQDALPCKWLAAAPAKTLELSALQNEYYAFQLGVYASKQALKDVRVRLSDFVSATGAVIPASTVTCFNTGGIDPYGKPFTKEVNVAQGHVQALWMGIDIAPDARPGLYLSKAEVVTADGLSQQITVRLRVEDGFIADRGDGEPWRHSRLRWLNSTAGISNNPVAPYTSMSVQGQEISCFGRSIRLNQAGFPETVNCWGHSLLAAPVRMVVESSSPAPQPPEGRVEFTRKESGIVAWQSLSETPDYKIVCTGEMEFDGYIHYRYRITAGRELAVSDIRLEIPIQHPFADYMMGMGLRGVYTPEKHDSKWQKTEDSFWAGNPQAGIYCELTGGSYHGPLPVLYQPDPPKSWNNEGNGGFRIRKNAYTTATAYSGPRVIPAGESVEFEFDLLPTPVKPINYRSQFTDRYCGIPRDEDLQAGCKIINVHHGTEYNPYINYPFIHNRQLKEYVDTLHQQDRKVKIYYTIRELTNYATELWALRSLDHEILGDGRGGGFPWLREHLVSGYLPQWYHYFAHIASDAAIVNTGKENRWYNYYIEGLSWLIKNMDIDGLYLDDVSFDRDIIKRMRNVMEEAKPGCIIDLHSNTGFSKGAPIQYAKFFPYVDKLMFGEGCHYNTMSPDNWLVEASGIPFGLMGDMLHNVVFSGGANPWRGVVYGLSDRGRGRSNHIWKVWNGFGIADSRMIGYWEQDCPVKTDKAHVLATAYVKEGKTLVSIASWEEQAEDVKLLIDWKALGISPENAKLTLPAIQDFQDAQALHPDETIRVEPKQGKLIYIQ
ncbi:MAG: DUF6067 family protein [Tannerella sp.]|jgi:hypothetical protein|nr:DUF6067 family protein [Tannerella sp.]